MKKIFTLLLCTACCIGLYAQPVITSSFNPAPGEQYRYHPVNTQITPGNSGANITWDFSGIQIIYNPIIGKYINPSQTPYANDFTGSNVAFEDYFAAGTYHYFETTTNHYEKKGEASVLYTAVYQNPHTMFTYPFTYNTVVTDNFACTTAVGSLTLERNGTWEANGDAYGTLMLPSGTHSNVLRIKTTCNTVDEYPGVIENGKNVIEYCWVIPTSKRPLLKIGTEYHFSGGAPIDTVYYVRISEEVSGIAHPDQNLSNIRLYPNPVAGDELAVGFEMQHQAEVKIELVSADGKVSRSMPMQNMAPGTHQVTVAMEGLAPGLWFVRVDSGGIPKMFKVVKL
ncbi:MAG: T9SS type A sorting domain-containing protein [Bacteroidales bacterium]